MKSLACEVRIQAGQTHTDCENAAGDELSSIKRPKRRNPRLGVHLNAAFEIVQRLDDNMHVVELARESSHVVLFIAFLCPQKGVSTLPMQ